MDSAVAVVVGAVISGVVGLMVVVVQQVLARRHELNTAKAVRLSEFSAAGWAATRAIIELARAAPADKATIAESHRFRALVDRFNSALAQIQLLDDGEVYAAAHRVDACLVALTNHVRSAQADQESWRASRAELSAQVAQYQRAARRALGSSDLPGTEPWLARIEQLQRHHGGPNAPNRPN